MKRLPSLNDVNIAYFESRARDPECRRITIGEIEYRLVTMPDEPVLAWHVWAASAGGDILVDKRDGRGLARPVQTTNEGYQLVSILRENAAGGDAYLRRRTHTWIAHAFHGAPPSLDAIVEHLDDDPQNNDADNLAWSTHGANRARRTANDKLGCTPTHKTRNIPLNIRTVRLVRERTGYKGRKLAAYVEQLITKDLSTLAERE